ncbi:MAG: DUF2190 family protein [Magnetococcales bacterium]|nr:DUF2190 family protein [Magnetococcales bacterium]
MAKNYTQEGNVLVYTNGTGTDIVSGDLVKVGVRVGVALGDIADTESGTVQVSGVFSVPKEAALAVTQGDLLYLDATSGELDKTATAQTLAGYAFESAIGAASVVQVKLNG